MAEQKMTPQEAAALRAQLLQLRREREQLRDEVAFMRNSRSWRITSPLRSLTQWGRDLRDRLRPERAPEPEESAVSLPRGGLARRALLWKEGARTTPLLGGGRRVSLWTARKGNAFFEEIARLLQCGLEDAGVRCAFFSVDSLEECLRHEDGTSAVRLIIAPHEFFHFIRDAESWPLNGAQLWLLNSEQEHTSWFAAARAHFRKASLVLDMDCAMAARLRSQGIPAEHMPLLYSPSCRLFDGAAPVDAVAATEGLPRDIRERPCAVNPLEEPLAERPLDCCFFGVAGERRSRFFARNAALFADMQAYLRLEDRNMPLIYGENSSLSTQTVSSIVRRCKIALNVHQSKHLYFEWHRMILQGIWQGAAVVSEPCTESWPFRADEDYIAASLEDVPAVLEYLLRSDEGMAWAEKVRRHGWETLADNPLARRWNAIFEKYGFVEEKL